MKKEDEIAEKLAEYSNMNIPDTAKGIISMCEKGFEEKDIIEAVEAIFDKYLIEQKRNLRIALSFELEALKELPKPKSYIGGVQDARLIINNYLS